VDSQPFDEDRIGLRCSSRPWLAASYVEFVTDEQLETLLGRYEQAFSFFGAATPRRAPRQHADGGNRWTRSASLQLQLPRRSLSPSLRSAEVQTIDRGPRARSSALSAIRAELLRTAGQPAQHRGSLVDCDNAQCARRNGQTPRTRTQAAATDTCAAIGSASTRRFKRPAPQLDGYQYPLRVYEELISTVELR
jgi:hypothetical protein